mmetsp:Transcript_57284/g.65316  ORF Transcript_57284/g.65316 Transcript_57284/m.65316 type:complete len:135 (-) Transcript_57284:182-586(-)
MMLESNRTLKELCLTRNNLKDVEFSWLAKALKFNSTLERLDLSYNSTGKKGLEAMIDGLMINTGLKMIDLAGSPAHLAGGSIVKLLEQSKTTRVITFSEGNISEVCKKRLYKAAKKGNTEVRVVGGRWQICSIL